MQKMVLTLIAITLMIAISVAAPVQLSGTNLTTMHTMIDHAATPEQKDSSSVVANLQLVALQQPGIADARVVMDAAHIGITLRPSLSSNQQVLNAAMTAICRAYLGVVSTGYKGLMRIGIVNGASQVIDLYEIPANANFGTHTSISYYLSDGYGDITKTVEHDGTMMSPSKGDWL